MKNLLTLFISLVLLSGVIFADETKMRTQEFPKKEMKKQNIEIAKLTAASISKDLPHTIDNYTKLTTVINEGATLVWTFEINTGAKSDESVRKKDYIRMKKSVTTGICQSSSKFLEAGINTSYVYVNAKSKVKLFRFDITQKDCI